MTPKKQWQEKATNFKIALRHIYDPAVPFCKKCGIAWTMAMKTGAGCTNAENVVGISHLRARQRLKLDWK